MVWYRNGSADDPLGKSGIAHFLEHLMFKGTVKNPAGKFSEVVADLGGQENAFTSNDFTAYFQRIPKEHLAVCMEYEADRMKNLVLTDEVVAPERNVVLEERRMRTDSDPAEILDEAMQAAVYTSHPYGKPVIGWEHEIETLDRTDAFNYYERFYTPENAILIVAGDIEPEPTIELARTIYGPIQPFGEPPRRRRPQEPRPTTHRQVTLPTKGRTAALSAPASRALLRHGGEGRSGGAGGPRLPARRRTDQHALQAAGHAGEGRGCSGRALHGCGAR
jgi:Predicted Zn-dependent peptidases